MKIFWGDRVWGAGDGGGTFWGVPLRLITELFYLFRLDEFLMRYLKFEGFETGF